MKKHLTKRLAMLAVLMAAGVLYGCRRGSDTADGIDSLPLPEMLDSSASDSIVKPEKSASLHGTAEILRFMYSSSDSAKFAAGILPQMAVDVPEYAAKLALAPASGFLIVDKGRMKLYRYDSYGRLQEEMGMACSSKYGTKHKRRDNRTPEGFFTIEGIYDSTDWLYTDDDGNKSDVKGQFGPRFMRLRTPVSSQIGIHGTCAPWSIGGRRSHGCIRVTNENILRLVEIVEPGWPVIVSPGTRDLQVNADEGYDIPTVSPVPGRQRIRLRSDYKPKRVETDSVTSVANETEDESKNSSVDSATDGTTDNTMDNSVGKSLKDSEKEDESE